MQTIIDYIVARLKEPSTYVSLGALLTAVGWQISPENWNTIATVCMGLGSLIGVLLSDRRTTPQQIANVVQTVVKPEAAKVNPPTPEVLDAAMKKPAP